jgi:hypothetical protein
MLGSREHVDFVLRWKVICFHIIPSSPIPGSPALTPNPKPTAAIWLFSFRSGLQGGECWRCLEMSAEIPWYSRKYLHISNHSSSCISCHRYRICKASPFPCQEFRGREWRFRGLQLRTCRRRYHVIVEFDGRESCDIWIKLG